MLLVFQHKESPFTNPSPGEFAAPPLAPGLLSLGTHPLKALPDGWPLPAVARLPAAPFELVPAALPDRSLLRLPRAELKNGVPDGGGDGDVIPGTYRGVEGRGGEGGGAGDIQKRFMGDNMTRGQCASLGMAATFLCDVRKNMVLFYENRTYAFESAFIAKDRFSISVGRKRWEKARAHHMWITNTHTWSQHPSPLS